MSKRERKKTQPTDRRTSGATGTAEPGKVPETVRDAEILGILSVLDGFPGPVWLQAPDYTVRFANRRFREIFRDAEGRPCHDLFHGREEPCSPCVLFGTADVSPSKHGWTAPDGCVYEVHCYPYGDGSGAPLVLSLGVDVTGRQRAEEALRESESKYRIVADNAYNWEFWLGPDLQSFLYVSPACERITGRPARAFVEDPGLYIRIIHPDDRPGFVAHMRRSRKDRASEDLEFRVVRPDGSLRWIGHVCQPVFGADGAYLGIRGSNRDITQRKKAETEYRTILATAMDGFWVSDHEGRFLDVNDAACRHLGYTREELLGGMRLRDVEAAESPEETAAHIRKIREQGQDRFETRHRRKDGTLVDTGVSVHYADTGGGRFFAFIRDITERKMAEAALAESEARYRGIVEDQTELLCRWRPDTTLSFVNEAYCRYFGRSKEELLGTSFCLLIPETEREAVRDFVARMLHLMTPSDPAVTYEHPVLDRGGEGRWQQWTDRAIFDGEGALVEIQSVGRDTTERVRAEEALRESTEALQAIIEASPMAIGVLDPEKRVTLWNPAAETTFGWNKEEVLGRVVPAVPEDLRDVFESLFRRTLSGEQFSNIEARGLRKDGTRINLLASTAPLRDASGRVRGTMGIFSDITARRKAEAALKESEERFRSLVAHALVGFFLVQEGKIVFLNPEQEKLFGPVPEGLSLEKLSARVHPEDRARFFALCGSSGPAEADTPRGCREEGLEKGKEETAQPRLLRTDLRLVPGDRAASAESEVSPVEEPGSLRWVHSRATPILYRGKPALLVNMVDVTRARELERVAALRDKMASLGHVAAGIAHEIRNPLSGLNIYLSAAERLFEESEALEPEIRENAGTVIAMMKTASDKIESVIRKVLDFARPAPSRLSLVPINQAVREAVQLARTILRRNGIRLETDLAEDLPPCYADLRLIEQVLLNLVTNAAQALEGREGRRAIRVASAGQESSIVIRVADSGPGVPKELREKIFDPFFTTKEGGTGIGLSFSRRVVADHGGFLEVGESDLGGAEFRIRIPVGDKRKGPRP